MGQSGVGGDLISRGPLGIDGDSAILSLYHLGDVASEVSEEGKECGLWFPGQGLTHVT